MRWDVINELLSVTPGRRFLEIGVQKGICGNKVATTQKWGVDPNPLNGAQRRYHKLYRCESDSFFQRLAPTELYDVVLVDGLHHADQVHRDVRNALKHLADGGFVVMHDCNPQSEIAQRVPRETGVWNGDCWKAMVSLRQRDDLDAFTIDADHGIGIVRKRRNPDPLRDVPQPLTYQHLEADRDRLVGLVPASDWRRRLGHPLHLGRVVVMTAIFGGKDEPLVAPSRDVDECIMFTDGDAAAGWTRVEVPATSDPRREARRHKALALDLVDGDIVVWIDGRIKPTKAALKPLLTKALGTRDIASFPHPWRDCAYTEARECADLGLADADALSRQTDEYRAEGFPERAGLWNTMVMARRRTDQMVDLGREWWRQMQRHTLRDQVSLPYLLWKHGIECGRLGNDVYRDKSSAHFVRGGHRILG